MTERALYTLYSHTADHQSSTFENATKVALVHTTAAGGDNMQQAPLNILAAIEIISPRLSRQGLATLVTREPGELVECKSLAIPDYPVNHPADWLTFC